MREYIQTGLILILIFIGAIALSLSFTKMAESRCSQKGGEIGPGGVCFKPGVILR